MASAPVAIRELVADAVCTSRVGLAQQAGTSIVWDEMPLPAFIVVRRQPCVVTAWRVGSRS